MRELSTVDKAMLIITAVAVIVAAFLCGYMAGQTTEVQRRHTVSNIKLAEAYESYEKTYREVIESNERRNELYERVLGLRDGE